MKKLVLAIGAIAAAILLAFTFWPSEDSGIVELVLAENASPLSTLTIVAREKGYFEEEGLAIKLSKFTSGKLALDAVLGGGADVATVAETPLMFAGFSGHEFTTIATIFESPNACKVVARKDKGITKVEDLKDRKVATFAGTNAEFFMNVFLAKHGLASTDMTVVNLQPTDMVFALKNGDIDAYFVWEPHIYNGKNIVGEDAIVFEEKGIYVTTFNLAVTKKYAENNPESLEKFLKAMLKAEEFVANNESEAIKIVANYTGIELTTLTDIWAEYEFPVILNKELVGYFEGQAKWAIESGRAKGEIPDYLKHIYPGPLKDLRAESVQY